VWPLLRRTYNFIAFYYFNASENWPDKGMAFGVSGLIIGMALVEAAL
jgi:hypothetical protein